MKKIPLFFLFLFLSMSLGASDLSTKAPLPTRQMDHVGIIVKDIESTIDHWVEVLGLEERPKVNIAAGDSQNPTQYRGEPSNAQAKLAFIALDNIKLELIEPIGEGPSHWHEFLKTKGEGVHHFGFWVASLDEEQVGAFEKCGHCLAQHGGWKTGEYGYMETHEALGVTIELLENYNQ